MGMPAACAPTGAGVCRYVDAAAGNDSNGGTSAQPFKTVQHAADVVNPGDVVTVRDGVYTGSSSEVLSLGRSGTASDWVVFKSEHKWGAVLDAQYNFAGTVVRIDGNFVRVEGFEAKGSRDYGSDPSTSAHDIQMV